jgi:hypothetical protein
MKTLGTIKRGKVKVKSKKQLRFLFAKKLPFTLMHKTKSGRVVKKRMNTK